MDPVRGADAGAEAVSCGSGGGRHADGFGPGKRAGDFRRAALVLVIVGPGGAEGEPTVEGVAENGREHHPLAVAAGGRLPPPVGVKRGGHYRFRGLNAFSRS